MNRSNQSKRFVSLVGGVVSVALLLSACQTDPATRIESADGTGLGPVVAQEHPDYAVLGGHKAQAVSYATQSDSQPTAWFNHVFAQPNPVVAAMQALAACNQARELRTSDSQPCELRRRGDTVIHSGSELQAGLSAARDALLWRVTGDAGTAYVAGSIHVLKATIGVPPSYSEAFSTADVLVLELDRSAASKQQVAQLVMRLGMLPDNQTLSDLLSPADMERVNTYVTNLGIPAPMIARMQPAMLLLQASVLEYMAMGYQGELGVESIFEAQKGNRAIVGLETMEAQLRAATALPVELQTQLLLETLSEMDNAVHEISELIHAWLAGDALALDKIFNQSATESQAAQRWLDDLLTKRNVGMAEGIAELLRTSNYQQPFVLVGAAHLVGANSVISLLEQQGFEVTQLRSNTL